MRRPVSFEPIVIVVDASVFASALADDGAGGEQARARLSGELLIAPELLDIEVMSTIRGRHAGGHLSRGRAELALADLITHPLERVPHRSLLPRCWQLRANLTCYDAAYVALAESLATTLITADRRLARAPGTRCEVEVLS
jgi:predicted nucleic acid-binding protein